MGVEGGCLCLLQLTKIRSPNERRMKVNLGVLISLTELVQNRFWVAGATVLNTA